LIGQFHSVMSLQIRECKNKWSKSFKNSTTFCWNYI